MKLNLYQLCDNDLSVGSIRVILNENLKNQINHTINQLKQTIKLKDLSKKFGVDYTTLWSYCNRRNYIPLIVLKRLEELSNTKFSQEEFNVICGQAKTEVRLPIKINVNLAKIIGAIIADGHIGIRKSGRGQHYELVIREEYLSNVLAFSKWFKEEFGIYIKPKKENNHYYFYISNKIIILYLTNVLKIPSGKKVDIISVPKIFKNSSKKTKLALLQGIFMFDGGVDYCTGYVSLVSRSPNLIRDVIILLNEINLQPDYISKKMDKFQRSRLLFRKNSKLVNNINLFEKDTEKWFRLNEHFYGLSNKTKDLNKALRNLDKFYPKKRKNALTFSDVIKVVHSLQDEATYKNVVKKLGKGKTVTYTYLDKLTKWKILNSKRRGLEKIWQLNQELYFPRR